jgi:predicted permease
MTRLGIWLRSLRDRKHFEKDLDEELRSYLDMLTDEKIEEGKSPQSARREARMALGGVEQVKENVREARVGAFVESVLQDLVYGLRALRRNPGFTAVAVLTLGLAIGANTAIFSVVNAVLLKPLPYANPDRLVRLWSAFPARGVEEGTTSPHDLEDWREGNQVFESLTAYPSLSLGGLVWTGGDVPEQLETTYVTEDFFETMGTPATLGRTFVRDDHTPGRNRVVVLSHRNWQGRFGGRQDIVGKTLTLSGNPFVVIGVMPPSFEFPYRDSEMWAPLSLIPDEGVPRRRNIRWLSVVARLKPDVTLDQARADMNGVATRLFEEFPKENEGLTAVTLRRLDQTMVADSRAALLTVFGAVGFVLLIGCANVANLLLARGEGRHQELAVRTALGAGRWRLVRQSLVESVTLALLGAGVGLVLSFWGVNALVALAPRDIPRLSQVSVEGTVLAFTAGLAVLTGIAFGLLPALRASRTDHHDQMKEGARGSLGEGRKGSRGLLVVAEVALVVVLAIGAGLLIRSFNRLLRIDPGIETENLLTMTVAAPSYKYPESAQIASFFDEVMGEVETIPGVENVGFVRPLPLRSDTFEGESFAFTIVGREDVTPESQPRASLRFVSGNYFRTMGIPLLAGRDFDSRDGRQSTPVLIISRTTAERYWPPGDDPIGDRITVGGGGAPIVGIVDDVRQMGLDQEPTPAIYACVRQVTRRGMTLVARTRGDPLDSLSAIQRAIWRINPEQPINDIASMKEIVSSSLSQPRFSMTLLSLFAGLALTLAAVGIYGVVSYSVNRRAHEFGLRMALGARASDVLMLVMSRGLVLTGLGVGIGLVAALGVSRWMQSLLFQVPAYDLWTYFGVCVTLMTVALAAAVVPAVNAMRVDPIEVLRHE